MNSTSAGTPRQHHGKRRRPSGEEFGEQRLEEALRRHRHLPTEALVDAVIDELKQFSSGEQNDDITLIVAHCKHD